MSVSTIISFFRQYKPRRKKRTVFKILCHVIWHRHNFSIVMSRGILGEFSLFPPCCSRPAFVVARLNRPRDILAKLIDWRGIHSQNERPDHVNAFPWINFRRLTMRRPLLLAPPPPHSLDHGKKMVPGS